MTKEPFTPVQMSRTMTPRQRPSTGGARLKSGERSSQQHRKVEDEEERREVYHGRYSRDSYYDNSSSYYQNTGETEVKNNPITLTPTMSLT